MLDLALAGSALVMGLAGSLHCAGMCGAACAGLTRGGQREAVLGFQFARLLSYAVGGALVAASVGGLLRWEQGAAWLRPVWLGLHLAALALGLTLLWRGAQPAWLQALWGARAPQSVSIPVGGLAAGGVQLGAPRRAALAGLAWVAWPCGLLQSALVVAALASGPWAGALVMAAFAAGSSPGLLAAPWLLRRWLGQQGRGLSWAIRLSGGLLAAGSLWALGHGLWAQWQAFCA